MSKKHLTICLPDKTSADPARKIEKRAVFIMTFKRKIAYHVISVYLPSSTTFVISLITMYVHNKHIEAIIVVHLTAMLVMTTLFQAISVSLPQVGRSKCFPDLIVIFPRHPT